MLFIFKCETYGVNKLCHFISFLTSNRAYHKEFVLFVDVMYSILKHTKKTSDMPSLQEI